MSRRESNRWMKNEEKTKNNGLKHAIEKGIILGAFFVIIVALFLFPKYEVYRLNGDLLKEKNKISLGYPEEMTEKKYLGEVESIRGNLELCNNNIPESIESAGLYQSIVEMAKQADIELVTVEFKPINIEIEDPIGLRIRTDFMKTENKTIVGPDNRTLANCPIAVVCIGDEPGCIRFIRLLENHQPIIKVIDMGIKGEDLKIKTMTLNLKSYGTLDGAETESLK